MVTENKQNKISVKLAASKVRLVSSSFAAASLVLLLLSAQSPIKPVDGQLEAVSAVLSVVPVTSILATAGLVGVKLAAISRLLQALGYDQAYLASGNSGTAAQPIGLQTNYAYMFPYVPGLNISVKAEHSGQYHNSAGKQRKEAAAQAAAAASNAGNNSGNSRKTYPAMGLPGDYESQSAPFRGAETLHEIFKSSGINVHFPSQQQLANLGLPPMKDGQRGAIVLEFPAANSGRAPAKPAHAAVASPASSAIQPAKQPAAAAAAGQHAGGDEATSKTQVSQQLLASKLMAAHKEEQQQQPLAVGKQPAQLGSGETFGMPALNINLLENRRRRRKRSSLKLYAARPSSGNNIRPLAAS